MNDLLNTTYLIRPSSLPTWADCPRRAAASLFGELIAAAGYELRQAGTGVGATVGSGCHAGAAYMLRSKMEDGTLGDPIEARDRAIAEFKRRVIEEGVVWDQTSPNRNTAERQILRMTHAYRRDIAPGITPVLVEARRNADLGDGFAISGQLDQLQAEMHRLHDLKTGVVRRAHGSQYGSYSMLCRAHGYRVDEIVEDHVKRVSIRKDQPPGESHQIPIEVAEQDATDTIVSIKSAVTEFVRRVNDPSGPPPSGAFHSNPYSQLCSPKYCGAWGTKFCRSHLGAT